MPVYLFDTGPLLCFASTTRGPQLLRDRYDGKAAMLVDIDRELRGLSRNPVPPVQKAARRASSSFTWIDRVAVDDELLLTRADQLRYRLRAFKRHPDRDDGHARKDWGECMTIAHAESLGSPDLVLIVANDTPARQLAGSLGLRTACAVDILRTFVEQEQVTRKQGYAMYRDMMTATLDPGETVRHPNDLVRRRDRPR